MAKSPRCDRYSVGLYPNPGATGPVVPVYSTRYWTAQGATAYRSKYPLDRIVWITGGPAIFQAPAKRADIYGDDFVGPSEVNGQTLSMICVLDRIRRGLTRK